MAQKTPAQLTAATDVEDGDLLLSWRPTAPGPLKSVTWAILKAAARLGLLQLTGGELSGALGIDAGSEGAPGLYFVGDSDTGIYRVGANSLGFSTEGVQRARINSSGITATGFVGPVTGNVTGDVSGNAGTATRLATARAISATGDATWTVNFDGSAAASGALTIASGAVTLAKMQSRSAETLLGRGEGGGSGAPEEITLGAGLQMSGTVLSATAGSMVLIGSSAASSGQQVPFTSIAATYRRLWLIGDALTTTGAATLTVQISTSNGSGYSTILVLGGLDGSGSEVVAQINNYAAATGVRWAIGENDGDTAQNVQSASAAINAVQFFITANAFNGGTAYLYGES
jgi:hypothetical protein